ncbi:Cache sensor protein [Cecembia rubra]|uniref:Cache domain-containing protein n=1 Tax=Cecembia rubra TaxID=1485585 RepID=A0A2P8EAJ9_9BACT|nr:Cache sensor protein [Cecembia rubra]PSL06490.1 hypothetical protein CLV48_102306 [Cecembia rubra]
MKYLGVFWALFSMLLVQCKPTPKEKYEDVLMDLNSFISLMEYDLQELEQEILLLGEEVKNLYAQSDQLIAQARNSDIPLIQAGVYNNAGSQDPNLGTIYIPSRADNLNEVREMYIITKSLDEKFKSIIQRNSVVTQVYFNSKYHFNKLYPPYDALAMLDPDLDVTIFNFYYEAIEENNPQRKPVWVDEIYIDPVGRGWMISLIYPIYVGDDLKMVLGFDITLNDIIESYLEKFDRNFVIFDVTGTLVAGKTKAIESLSLPPLKNHTYKQTITSDSFRLEDFNLFRSKSKEVRELASKIILNNEKKATLKDLGLDIQVSAAKMTVLDWVILDLVY